MFYVPDRERALPVPIVSSPYRCGLHNVVVVVFNSFVVNDDQSDSARSFDQRAVPPIERALHLLREGREGREGKGGGPRAPFSFSEICVVVIKC